MRRLNRRTGVRGSKRRKAAASGRPDSRDRNGWKAPRLNQGDISRRKARPTEPSSLVKAARKGRFRVGDLVAVVPIEAIANSHNRGRINLKHIVERCRIVEAVKDAVRVVNRMNEAAGRLLRRKMNIRNRSRPPR